MNDPNGLICHEGVYHLYYQHNPHNSSFGSISWGHATSTDLKTWEHQPIAIHAYDKVKIYSGCVVLDHDNVLKQSRPSLAAIYTEHEGDENHYHERICLAISQDEGNSFDQENRTVILERDTSDFRDPKVFFYGPGQKWIMVIALPRAYTICIYSSVNLTDWKHESDFTSNAPHTQFWECPDLYPLWEEDGTEHWVLSVSGGNSDHKTWGMFYFVGEFDGVTFATQTTHQWFDFGRDFYAGITFEGTGPEKIMIAWCNNWLTANDPHNRDWSGIMSSPRILRIKSGQLAHKLITTIAPLKIDLKTTSEIPLTLNAGQINLDHSSIQVMRNGQQIDRRNFPFKLNKVWIYEDHGLIELLFNEGLSCTWLLS